MIFPPPPFRPREDDGSGTNFSPLIIAVIAILASAFLLVSYYTIISKYCKRRIEENPRSELDLNVAQMTQDQWHVAPSGLDESLIKSIAVCKYKKCDGFVEETECSVCLSEFKEDENLRLLPKCSHAFHLSCIDTWLRSHSNCPLCRSVVSLPPPSLQISSSLNVSSLQIQRSDVVLVVDECERGQVEEVFVGVVNGDDLDNNMENLESGNVIQENGEEGVLRRSISLGSSSFRRNLLIADILRFDEGEEDLPVGDFRSPMKRSISTGRFVSTRNGKAKNSILPN